LIINWDNDRDRTQLLVGKWPSESGLLVLDEIHKYSRWKNWLKGQYDTYNEHFQFLVTGSAKLNVFQHKGDSLFGCSHYYCLHPFSYTELLNNQGVVELSEASIGKALLFRDVVSQSIIDQLLKFGGCKRYEFADAFFPRVTLAIGSIVIVKCVERGFECESPCGITVDGFIGIHLLFLSDLSVSFRSFKVA